MEQLTDRIWFWQAPYPGWTDEQDWPELVTSYAIDTGDRLLLLDPLAVPAGIARIAAGKTVETVLTCPWHSRDALQLGHPIHVPPPDDHDPDPVPGEVYRAGDDLPFGVRAFPGLEPNDLVLHVESARAVIAGDTIIDRGDGPAIPPDWAERRNVTVAEIQAGLRPLLDLPVEHLLLTHGLPQGRDALERVLS